MPTVNLAATATNTAATAVSLTAPAAGVAPAVLGGHLPVTLADGSTTTHANLDYAATAPCLAAAAAAVNELLPWYASVHRGAGAASRRCTLAYEQARETITEFLGARDGDHVIFTRNTTDALNLLARAVPEGTTVVGWAGEHHANLLPWRNAYRLPVPSSPEEAVSALAAALAHIDGPVLVTVTGASNVTGEVWPVEALAEVAHAHGARIVVDAAQLAPHRPVSLQASGIDYIALSGHKLYAPYGAGVLAGRGDWLDAAEPYLAGGGATAHVGDIGYGIDPSADIRWQSGPARHEAGTPNLLGAVALAAVCAEIASSDRAALAAHENELLAQLRAGLAGIAGVEELRTFAPGHDRVGIVSFTVAGVAAPDVSAFLSAEYGIGVRDGLFCAHPFTRQLLADATARSGGTAAETTDPAAGCATPGATTAVRASIGIGSTAEHVERLLTGVRALTNR